MIDPPYSLIIEATEEPDYFGFYFPDIEGFTGIGHSVEDCIYKARWGMKEHIALLREQGLPRFHRSTLTPRSWCPRNSPRNSPLSSTVSKL